MNAFLYAATGRAYILDLIEPTGHNYKLNACTVYYGCYPEADENSPALAHNFSIRIFF